MPSEEAERLANSRAQVQTDSLTVILDLKRLQPAVAEGFCEALGLPERARGTSLPPQSFDVFQQHARDVYARLASRSRLDALEFATILSAFLHECRHVHDMRATRCGAELLLKDLHVYTGVTRVLESLAEWHRKGNRYVPFPVTAGLDRFDGESPVREHVQSADATRLHVERWWNARSKGPTLPGHSIRSLFEALGYSVQVEWLAGTFGGDVADSVMGAAADLEAAAQKYLRPSLVMANLMVARGVHPDPEAHDLSWLALNALNMSGIDEAFDGDSPSERHPGTWFDRFAQQYAMLAARKDIAAELVAPYAVESVSAAAGTGGPKARYERADAAIQTLQDDTLRTLGRGGLPDVRYEGVALLIATEVAIDFRDMQRAVATMPRYHVPMGYVAMLMAGALTGVHVRVNNPDGTLGDFRTPSLIPSNHVGGARAASEASQQMRILLKGRDLVGTTFFEETVYRRLKAPPPDGWGLSFRRPER